MYPSLAHLLSKKDVNKSDAILIARLIVKQDYTNKIVLIALKSAKFMTHSKSI